jgi:hypothetical protein
MPKYKAILVPDMLVELLLLRSGRICRYLLARLPSIPDLLPRLFGRGRQLVHVP